MRLGRRGGTLRSRRALDASVLEDRVLFSAAPIDVAVDSTLEVDAGLVDLINPIGFGEFGGSSIDFVDPDSSVSYPRDPGAESRGETEPDATAPGASAQFP